MADPRKYIKIAGVIRQAIDDGKLRPDDNISIEGIVKEHGVARQTAAKALRILADEGRVERWPGLGYYIAGSEGIGSCPANDHAPASPSAIESINNWHDK